MKIRNRRLIWYGLGLVCSGAGLYLILDVFSSSMTFFLAPQEFFKDFEKHKNQLVRLGGFVKKGSVIQEKNHTISFVLTDFNKDIPVRYKGLIPSLFREEKGAVVKGRWAAREGYFQSHEILAKHDENYVPPKVEALTKQGHVA